MVYSTFTQETQSLFKRNPVSRANTKIQGHGALQRIYGERDIFGGTWTYLIRGEMVGDRETKTSRACVMMNPRNTVSVDVGPVGAEESRSGEAGGTAAGDRLDSIHSLGLIGVSEMHSSGVRITNGVTYGSGGRFDQTKP